MFLSRTSLRSRPMPGGGRALTLEFDTWHLEVLPPAADAHAFPTGRFLADLPNW